MATFRVSEFLEVFGSFGSFRKFPNALGTRCRRFHGQICDIWQLLEFRNFRKFSEVSEVFGSFRTHSGPDVEDFTVKFPPTRRASIVVVHRVDHTRTHVDTLYSCSRPQQMLTLHSFMKRRNEYAHHFCVMLSERQLFFKAKTPSCSLCDI